MPKLQSTVQRLRRIAPRGWSPLLARLARRYRPLQTYKASLQGGDHIYIDLRESMCHGYFFDGGIAHEKGTQRLLQTVLEPGGTFVDVGANIGFFTRMASALVGSGGNVVAIEPSPQAFRLLQRNTQDLPGVMLVRKAVGATPGNATFYVRKQGDTSSLDHDPAATPISVEVSTLDDVLDGCLRIDIIKIDVEGFEHDVILGGQKIIAKTRPIVYFEYIQELAQKRKLSVADFEQMFSTMDLSLSLDQ